MPKLPAIPPQKLAKVLEKKGFVLDRIRGSHHVYVHPETKVTISLPIHRTEIKKGILLGSVKSVVLSSDKSA